MPAPASRYGLDAVTADFKEEGPAKIHWSTERSFVASSGDLGVSIGMIRPNEPPKAGEPDGFPFFTVWKRDAPERALALHRRIVSPAGICMARGSRGAATPNSDQDAPHVA